MTVVLVAFKGLVEGSKKNTIAPLVCQSGVIADRRKGGRAGRPPGSQSLLLHSEVLLLQAPSHLFSLFLFLLLYYSPLSLSLFLLSPSALLSLAAFLFPILQKLWLS